MSVYNPAQRGRPCSAAKTPLISTAKRKEDPNQHPGREEKPGTANSPGVRSPAAGESSASDIRGNSNIRWHQRGHRSETADL